MTEVEIISGFLGAGKTTWIKKLLSEETNKKKIMLVENEFGQVGVDSGFLQEVGVKITELNSGCICCTLVGDFIEALEKAVKEYQPELILIEPSGVGKLSDIIKAVNHTDRQANIQLLGSVTIVDAKKAKLYLRNFAEFFKDQISYANVIILSHTDRLSDDELTEIVELIKKLNNHAHLVTTDWDLINAKEVNGLLNSSDPLLESMLMELENTPLELHHHEDPDHPDADDVFDSWGAETVNKYSQEELTNILKAINNLPDFKGVIRAKGFLPGEEGKWLSFDYIPGEPDVKECPAQYTGKICVIGTELPKEKLERLFALK